MALRSDSISLWHFQVTLENIVIVVGIVTVVFVCPVLYKYSYLLTYLLTYLVLYLNVETCR